MYIAVYKILICYAKEDILRYILWFPFSIRTNVYLLRDANPPPPPHPPWWRQIHREHSFTRDKQGQFICPLSWSLHCNFPGDGKCNKRGWACTHHPHQPRLILPSWRNERQKADVPTMCTLWAKPSQVWKGWALKISKQPFVQYLRYASGT